jgi:hypothetical protein
MAATSHNNFIFRLLDLAVTLISARDAVRVNASQQINVQTNPRKLGREDNVQSTQTEHLAATAAFQLPAVGLCGPHYHDTL